MKPNIENINLTELKNIDLIDINGGLESSGYYLGGGLFWATFGWMWVLDEELMKLR